jgi:hypothetical protein
MVEQRIYIPGKETEIEEYKKIIPLLKWDHKAFYRCYMQLPILDISDYGN